MTKLIKKLIAWTLFGSFLVIAVLVFQLLSFQHNAINLPEEATVFQIKPGSNIKIIAQEMSLQKIIDDPWLFILLAKLKGVETRVRAGEYLLASGQTPDDLLDTFTSGNSIQYSLTVIEGWSFR
ncbi:MAG: endolytic transglycosylase MltG, partial [Gammaproteobacteria bacterium]|nr:endolytic transglycosylase MltG [Gammaproteobacteria bacterium]